MKKTVMFDIDDTLGQFSPAFAHFMSEQTRGKYARDFHTKWESYNLCEQYQCSQGDIENFLLTFEEQGWMEKMSPNQNIVQRSQQLCKSGHKVIIVTARGWMVDGRNITERWLNAVGVPYDELHVVPLNGSKLDYLDESVVEMYEDAIHHVILMAQKYPDATVNLCVHPWNECQVLLPKNVKKIQMSG